MAEIGNRSTARFRQYALGFWENWITVQVRSASQHRSGDWIICRAAERIGPVPVGIRRSQPSDVIIDDWPVLSVVIL